MCTRAPSHPFARWHSSVASIAPNVTTNLPVYAVLSAICMAFMLPQNVRYEHTRARYSNDTRTRNSRGERGTISRSPQIGEPLDSASANPLMRSRQWVSSLFLLHQGNLAELWRTGRDTVDGYVTQILVAGAPLSPQFRCAYRSILAGPYLAEGTDLKSSATAPSPLSPRAPVRSSGSLVATFPPLPLALPVLSWPCLFLFRFLVRSAPLHRGPIRGRASRQFFPPWLIPAQRLPRDRTPPRFSPDDLAGPQSRYSPGMTESGRVLE